MGNLQWTGCDWCVRLTLTRRPRQIFGKWVTRFAGPEVWANIIHETRFVNTMSLHCQTLLDENYMSHTIPTWIRTRTKYGHCSVISLWLQDKWTILQLSDGIGDERKFGVHVVYDIRFQAVNLDDFLFPSVSLEI